MTPFWFLVGGLGAMWFITSGRAQAVLQALTGATAVASGATSPVPVQSSTPAGMGTQAPPPNSSPAYYGQTGNGV